MPVYRHVYLDAQHNRTNGSSKICSVTRTVSVAIGASCIENAQSQDLGTLLAGQLARAAAIFNIDEVIVLDDGPKYGNEEISAASALFARVLQFMETPQYLRKYVECASSFHRICSCNRQARSFAGLLFQCTLI